LSHNLINLHDSPLTRLEMSLVLGPLKLNAFHGLKARQQKI
jgi:hypothetical protein